MKSSTTNTKWKVLVYVTVALSVLPTIVRTPAETIELPRTVLEQLGDVEIFNGGYGSGMARSKQFPELFYFMTDRGPNFDGPEAGQKVFPVPTFIPSIILYDYDGQSLTLRSRLRLRDENNRPLTGLPNPAGFGGTGETPIQISGAELPFDDKGIDPEGLVVMQDNSFWVSDEYGPHIIHFNALGATIERINPFGNGAGGRAIPQVFANRRPNRGMEGLTATPDEKFLVGIMQSSLDNPPSDRANIRRNSATTRILVFNIETGETQQFLYLQDAPALSNSEIRAISNHEFIVLERDGRFPNDPAGGTSIKRFYKIDLRGATDVSDMENGQLGRLFEIDGVEKTIEQMTLAELSDNHIAPVRKSLYLDLLNEVPGYPHDKPEGFEVLEDGSLAIINDDDFGIVALDGSISQKFLPATGEADSNILYTVAPPQKPTIEVTNNGEYFSGIYDESAAEIVAYEPFAQRLFVSNAFSNGIDIIDARDPENPKLVKQLVDLGGTVNSVAVHNGIVAVAVQNENPQENGFVVLLDALTGSHLNQLEVGAMPDMVTFTPNGRMLLTANEGEPNDDYTIDPEGSVSIINLRSGTIFDAVMAHQNDVHTVSFAPYNFLADFFVEGGIRIFGQINHPVTGKFMRKSLPSEDFEPEYIAVSPDSRRAYVVMQENNAIAVIDLVNGNLADLFALGYKDHSRPGFGFDASDSDGQINIRPWPVKGLYLPDAISAYQTLGKTFLVTANEGDSRDYDGFSEELRVADLNLDPEAYPDAEELQMASNLGRLKTTNSMGDTDGDGDVDQIFSYGGRSFSIWDEEGNLIWDSGDQFETIIANLDPANFNSSNEENFSFDNRSDDKGPEPEAVTVGQIAGRHYAFIGLERQGGVMVYDITYPYAPTFVNYLTTRDFSVEFDGDSSVEALDAVNDLGPEGLVFVSADKSPNGQPMLIIANEVSGNTSLHTIRLNQSGEFKMQIIHSSDNESSFQDPNTLEPKILHYGAIVDGLQTLATREGIPSIYLTAGDHTLPGPFYQASEQAFGAPGLGDIKFFNAMGLTANGMGNHEFDGGINEFAQMLNHADYPFVAVNLDFSNVEVGDGVPAIRRGVDGGSVEENAGKVVRSAYAMVGGEKIGIIGRAPADFFNVIASPDVTLPGLDFIGGRNPENNQPLLSAVDMVLEQVALLEAKGINKIVLLDHAQDFTADPLSATSLKGIDIIVAAGSTGFMGNEPANGPFNLLRPGQSANAAYPTVREDSEGNTVLVVNSDQLYSYVGQLIVSFDSMGHINEIDDRSGPIATTREGVDALDEYIDEYPVRPTREVQEIYDALVGTPLIADLFEIVGNTEFPLNGARGDVRSRETNLGRLAADSTLWFANEWLASEGIPMQVDIALKNGGGIRNSILGPVITKLTVASALQFNNRLAILTLSGAELIAAMENAVSRFPARDGRFPQVAGMDMEFAPARPGVSDQIEITVPSRIRRLVIHKADGSMDVLVDDFIAQGDLSRQFTLATNDFLSTGGDGYRVFETVSNDPARGALRPEIGERQILSDYIALALGGEVSLPDPLESPRVRDVELIEQLFDPSLKPFYHGVASGDPAADGFIIWTRVTPDSPGPVDVNWEVSQTMEFSTILKSGTAQTGPATDYTVKVAVDGLSSGQRYYYRFMAMNAASITGRSMTTPEGDVDQLKFAVVSCVNYEAGFFSGFRHIAEMGDIDAVIHLGDSIYEYGRGVYSNPILAEQRRHFPSHEIVSLDDYRMRHSNYKLDKDLMMARAMYPFIHVWDDHEVANDGWKDGAQNHQEDTEGDYIDRKSHAIQAFHEWNPTSVNGLRIYRSLKFGNLVDLFMLDTRHIGRQRQINDIAAPELYAPDRTILGPTQKAWLKDQLSNSTAQWKLLGNQVIFSELNYWWAGPSVGQTPEEIESSFLDAWDGYPAERSEIINLIKDNGVDNLVILTGDSHTSWAFDVVDNVDTSNPSSDLLSRYNPVTGEGAVAVEFGVPSITSANFDEFFLGEGQSPEEAAATTAGFEFQINNPIAAMGGVNPNPHLKYVDLDRHGFMILTVTSANTKADYYYISSLVDPNATVELGKSVEVMSGVPFATAGLVVNDEANWTTRNFGPAVPINNQVDSDNDGRSNYEEYLYGTNPSVADKSGVALSVIGSKITISYSRNASAEVEWIYQSTADLGNSWYTLIEGVDYSVETVSSDNGNQLVSITILNSEPDARFFRILTR